MNLWLRLWLVVLRALRGQRIGLLETSRLHLRVWPNDLDINGHVNNGRYLTLADLGRIDYVVRSGAFAVARRHRAMPIVADAFAKFRRDLRPFQRFTIETTVLGWDEKWTFLEHRFVAGGRVAGVVIIKGLFKGRSGPLPPDTMLRELGRAGETTPLLPGWVREWARSSDALGHELRQEEAPLVTPTPATDPA